MDWQLIAQIEGAVILLLVYLISTRRIGRPLSEAEAQYKIRLKEEQKRAEEARQKREIEELLKQESLIAEMKTPIILVSIAGDGYTEPYNVCVQDGNKKIHNLFVERRQVSQFPKMHSMLRAAGWDPDYQWTSRRGQVIVP